MESKIGGEAEAEGFGSEIGRRGIGGRGDGLENQVRGEGVEGPVNGGYYDGELENGWEKGERSCQWM